MSYAHNLYMCYIVLSTDVSVLHLCMPNLSRVPLRVPYCIRNDDGKSVRGWCMFTVYFTSV